MTKSPIFNSGLSLAHPLQSSYALARRLQVANPTASLKESLTLYKKFRATEAVDSLEIYLPQDSRIGTVRQCAMCAQHMFHSAVYVLPAMNICPIHHVCLTKRCPDCGEYWERPLYVRHPRCETCCSPPWETLGKIAIKRKEYRRLQWLNNWLTRCQAKSEKQPYFDLLDLYGLLRPTTNVESPRFLFPTLNHPFYPAFEAQKQNGVPNARLAQLKIHTVDLVVKTRTTQLKRFNAFSPPEFEGSLGHNSIYTVSKSEQSKLFSLAIRRFLRWQCKTLGLSHRLNWYDLRGLRAEEVVEASSPCVLCMAFSFWCWAIALKIHDPTLGGFPGEHELCRFAHYRYYPQISEAVYLEDAERRHFRPSRSFERWLFLRSSDYAFMEYVNLSLWIYQRSKEGHASFRQTSYPLSEKFYNPGLPLSAILELTYDKDLLQAKFWPRSPLHEINLSDDEIRKVHHCDEGFGRVCPRIWSVAPAPKEMDKTIIRELLDRILPQYKLSPNQYPWTNNDSFDQRPSPHRPFISLRQPQNNMKVVIKS